MDNIKRRRAFTFFIYSFMMVFALSSTMLGTVLPQIIRDYDLTLSQAGLFPTFSGIGGFLAMLATSIFADKMKKEKQIAVIMAFMGLLLFSIGIFPPFKILLSIILFLSIAYSMLNLVNSAYVSDLYGDERSRYMNILHVFYGIGSLLGPAFPTYLAEHNVNWRDSYMIIGLTSLGLCVFYSITGLCIKAPEVQRYDKAQTSFSFKQLFDKKNMLVLLLISFIYMGGHQGAFSMWLPTYLNTGYGEGYTMTFVGKLMTIYWSGMVVSRTIASLFPKITPKQFIVMGSTAGVVILTLGLLINSPIMWILTVVILGFSTGAIYPLTMVMAVSQFPQNTGRVTSYIGIISSIGSMFFGWIIGEIANSGYFTMAMLIPVFTLFTVFLLILGYKPSDR